MRVPQEFAKATDLEVIVRLQTAATGKLEAVKKLGDLPAPGKAPLELP